MRPETISLRRVPTGISIAILAAALCTPTHAENRPGEITFVPPGAASCSEDGAGQRITLWSNPHFSTLPTGLSSEYRVRVRKGGNVHEERFDRADARFSVLPDAVAARNGVTVRTARGGDAALLSVEDSADIRENVGTVSSNALLEFVTSTPIRIEILICGSPFPTRVQSVDWTVSASNEQFSINASGTEQVDAETLALSYFLSGSRVKTYVRGFRMTLPLQVRNRADGSDISVDATVFPYDIVTVK